MSTRRSRRVLPLALALTLLAGCAAVGPDYEGPPASTAESVADWPAAAAPGPGAVATTADTPVAAWWQQLGDPALDALVTRAVAANYDLRVAAANVAAARAVLEETGTRRVPRVDVGAAVQERRDSSALLVIADPDDRLPGVTSGTFRADLSWEIDLFGRIRRSVEAARAALGSAEAVRDGVLVSLLAEVARAYVDLRGAQLRLDVAARNVAVQEQTLELVDVLLREGAATQLDEARARTQLMTSRSTIPGFEAAVRVAANRLTTLTAQPPGALDATIAGWRTAPRLAALPEFVATGRPADLLRRRPDVLAAERALAAAAAQIGVATADLFPTVTFGAAVGIGAMPLSGLSAPGAPFFSVGPSLTWNVFDRTAIYARIRGADSNAAASLARYEATVTRALEEADSAITAYRAERARRARLDEAVAASREAAELAALRYREGVEDFLAVLDAQRSLLILEDQRAVSAIGAAQRLVDIHLALGGGWDAVSAPEHVPYDPASTR